MKIFKIFFVLFLVTITMLFFYFTPYMFLTNLLKSANEGKNLSSYINEELIEYNIFKRYQRDLFSDINPEGLIEEQLYKKNVTEQSIKYGISVLIEPENLQHLFKAMSKKETEGGSEVKYSTSYPDINTFIVDVLIDNNTQKLIFKRKNVIIWEIQDIVFNTNVNIFDNWHFFINFNYWIIMALCYYKFG